MSILKLNSLLLFYLTFYGDWNIVESGESGVKHHNTIPDFLPLSF